MKKAADPSTDDQQSGARLTAIAEFYNEALYDRSFQRGLFTLRISSAALGTLVANADDPKYPERHREAMLVALGLLIATVAQVGADAAPADEKADEQSNAHVAFRHAIAQVRAASLVRPARVADFTRCKWPLALQGLPILIALYDEFRTKLNKPSAPDPLAMVKARLRQFGTLDPVEYSALLHNLRGLAEELQAKGSLTRDQRDTLAYAFGSADDLPGQPRT